MRSNQLIDIFSALSTGSIKSSTGDPSRGKGLPLVINHSKSRHFKSFKLIANDAYIDLSSNNVSVMNEHFSGTLYYFELTDNSHG